MSTFSAVFFELSKEWGRFPPPFFRLLLCNIRLNLHVYEHEFETRNDVEKWMLDRQLQRRSPNKLKRIYIIGRRYLVEKNANGGDRKSVGHFDQLKSTSHMLADQLSTGEKTVRRAAEFTQALDTVVANTGLLCNIRLNLHVYTLENIIYIFHHFHVAMQHPA
jgi:hypothetical protein